jgi:hypothetical protein
MRKMAIGMLTFCFWIGWVVYPHYTMADVEWRTIKEIDLKSEPLDIFQSPDGELLFILTRGEVLIYSARQQNITDRVPVDKEFDRITYSSQTKTLTLSSSTKKTLFILALEFIQKFDISGLPFKGPEDAPVVFVVFSDYQ